MIVKLKKDEFVKPLVDARAKEGKDKKVRLEAVFSKLNVKAKWYKGKEELFLGKKYHMQSEGDLHVLIINNPVEEDSGRYKIECMGISSSCIVEVDEPDPVYKFTKRLNDVTDAYTTKDIVLDCAASDKYVIEADPLGRKLLKIVDLNLNDCGQYMCKINAEEKTETKLVVTEQQFKFMKPLKSIKVIENTEVVLECELDDWEGKVQWFKGDKELKPDPVIEQVAQIRRRRLVFKGVRLGDQGKYTCKSNADSTVCEMIVEPANKVVKKLKDCTLLEREKAVLEVEMLDKKAPVEWFKNGEKITPTDRINIKMYDDGKHHLIFNNLELEDVGEYTCSAKDLSTSCKLTVEKAERAPIIKLDKFDFVGDSGKPYTIEVPYEIVGTRTTKAVAKLLRNGQAVSPKEIDIVVKEEKVLITFRKAVRASSAKYGFTLTNSQGEAACDINLNILDVPTPPEGPLEVFDVYRDRCKLAWKPCKDTGGIPLTHYLVERQDLGARGGWAEVGTTQDTKFDVTDLTPKKEYKFRIRAINEKGSSQPLVAPKTTFAKDPYDEPSKPGKVEIEDWDVGRVDIKWEKPESDGGAPITGYIVEYKDKFSGEWTTGPEVGPDELKCRVDGLKEGVQYQFRVKAVNKAGPGEPSDPSKPVIAKARYVKPYIIGDEVKGMIIKKGQMIKYEIQFGGEPPPTVKWSKDLRELDVSKIKDTTFMVKNAERADSGKYTLTLTNNSGSCASWGDVIVLDKPTAPRGPLKAEEVRADHVKLKWNQPDDTGGQELKGYVIEKMDTDTGRWVPAGEVGPHENTFTVDGLTPKKKYKFRVKAINKDGESPALVTEEPIEAKNPYDEPGKPPKPEIVDYDNTKVDLKWVPPDNDGGRPILHYIIEMKDKFSVAWTQVLKTEDNKCRGTVEGLKENAVVQFRLRAVNKAGIGEPSDPTANHVVKHRNLKPYIDRTNLKTQIIKVGRSIKYDVDIRGEPPPEVVWSFADRKVVQDDHIKIENKDYHSDFNIVKGMRKHSGKYTITATNASGKDMVTVDVTILGKPSKPEGPLEVNDIHKEGCKLKWNKPKDDGGAPIQQYEVEKFDKETGRWTRLGKVNGDKPEMEVTGLTPGKEYLFRVSAINEEDEPGKPGVPDFVDWDNTSVDMKWEPQKATEALLLPSTSLKRKKSSADMGESSRINAAGPSEPSEATKHHLVKHRKLKPYIDRTNLETTTLRKGKSFKLDVNIRGEPAPTVKWILKEKVVENSEHREIQNVEYNTKLIIHNAQRKYSGVYKIVAENEHGKDEAEVEINILAKGPLEVSNVHAKGCKLKWQPPEDDGGKPIHHYQVEKMDTATGNWVPVGRAEKMIIQKLTFLDSYLEKNINSVLKQLTLKENLNHWSLISRLLLRILFDLASQPGTPEIVDWDENMVDMKWQPPKSDGGAPITGYVIEKKNDLNCLGYLR
ncbi:twitchin [Caerostris extrusa]|uniref:Twitchin n=1 Tax=Caerostris extrusa TaxID=172846 RepID=A0AAV4UH86_CAEEX|nr:twitchin [Caerostris extrusa]